MRRAALLGPGLGGVEQRLADPLGAPGSGRRPGPRPRRGSRSAPSACPGSRCRSRRRCPPTSATSTAESCESIAWRIATCGPALVPLRGARARGGEQPVVEAQEIGCSRRLGCPDPDARVRPVHSSAGCHGRRARVRSSRRSPSASEIPPRRSRCEMNRAAWPTDTPSAIRPSKSDLVEVDARRDSAPRMCDRSETVQREVAAFRCQPPVGYAIAIAPGSHSSTGSHQSSDRLAAQPVSRAGSPTPAKRLTSTPSS